MEVDEDGRPKAPEVTTCPLSNDPVEPGTEASLDRAALDESAAHLPRSQSAPAPSPAPPPTGRAEPTGKPPVSTTVPARTSTSHVHVPPQPVHSVGRADAEANESAGRCATCNAWVDVGEGHLLPYTLSTVLQCDHCHAAESDQRS